MAVANHEASALSFPSLSGIFDVEHPKTDAGWLAATGELPYSGVMAEAVQSVAVTSRVAAENLLAVGYKGHAGYSKRYGGVDITVDAVLTENVQISGAYGYQLSDFEDKLTNGLGIADLTLYTTNSTIGKKIQVTGVYMNSVTFNFNQNDNSTTSWGFVGDGVTYESYSIADSGSVGDYDYHCVDPLTWDEVHIRNDCSAVVLTGVQSATFTANLNRTEIFEIGQFEPYDRAVTRPYNVSVSLNTLANEVPLVNWWEKFVPNYDPLSECDSACGGLKIAVYTQSIAGQADGREFIIASGLRPTTSTLNVAVGSNSTVALTFEGTDLRF